MNDFGSSMKFVNPILFVADVEISKSFYQDILGFRPVFEEPNFVRFEGGFAIHEGQSLARTVWDSDEQRPDWFGCRNVLLYFEHDAVDLLYRRISNLLDVIHPVQLQPWGQRVFRFYDPDRHAIEVGEPQLPADGAVASTTLAVLPAL